MMSGSSSPLGDRVLAEVCRRLSVSFHMIIIHVTSSSSKLNYSFPYLPTLEYYYK